MNIPENDALPHPSEPSVSGGNPSPVPPRLIAPLWHTCLLVLLFIGISVSGALHATKPSAAQHRIIQYLITLGFEWIIAAIAWWGIRLRRTPITQLIGERRRGFEAWRDDIAAAAVFWIAASILLVLIGSLLRLVHLSAPAKTIAPQSLLEIILWIALSISAGICEEFVFRGYMLQQFTALTHRLWAGILISSILFGLSHGYEGAAGMIAITAYGAMFCALTLSRRSLRPGIIAHAWHDSFSGIMLALARHLRLL
ncbi:CPBP family intramembrane glutamic endopeptidase [Paracidobacterium acidisoli]|nr:type II CAAX endopeptidase family protein [Paracidobacterium acidisoli]MBT9331695.1 CPBP family intramembrane metalloprotease [Paracidobacterium acidisoli]